LAFAAVAARMVVAVGRRHAGGHAFARFDRHRERRAVTAAVIRRHHRQFQFTHLVRAQAQAHDAAAFADHHGHGLHRHFFSGDDQVRFVLAVEIIEQDDRHAGAHGFQRGVDAAFQVVGYEGIGDTAVWSSMVKRSL
jgi:hypothetical protein